MESDTEHDNGRAMDWFELTPGGVGTKLRQLVELTAVHSQNWDNLEEIAKHMVNQVYAAGIAKGKADMELVILEEALAVGLIGVLDESS